VKATAKPRSILHVDLDPFFVSVERSLDPSLRGRAVIVGGHEDGSGVVAAASAEARAAGVRVGESVASARRACPDAVVRPGDFEAYSRVSQEVTAILLTASRRVERPSSDEAYVDLTRDGTEAPAPVASAEAIKDELQRRLGLDVSLGLASCRLAARVASSWARPRGLLVVLPGYEQSFLSRQPISFLPDLPPHLGDALEGAGLGTLGAVLETKAEALAALVGATAADRLHEAAAGLGEPPVSVAAPPTWVQEEAVVRDRRSDRRALLETIETLAERACRRLRPFGLAAGGLSVEVRRANEAARRDDAFEPGIHDPETARQVARSLGELLVDPAGGVRALQVRLSRLGALGGQAVLFPDRPSGLAGHRRSR
jgi:DNA polymerase-4